VIFTYSFPDALTYQLEKKLRIYSSRQNQTQCNQIFWELLM